MDVGLNASTAQIMDDEGRRILKGIMEKDRLGLDMKSEAENLRLETIKQTAKMLAIQNAVKWRYAAITKILQKYSIKLDRIFDFSPLLMKGGMVLPPVITEAGPGYRVESPTKASSTDKVFRIVSSARMISSIPTWRDYLLRRYRSFGREDIKAGALPKNEKEREIWEKAVALGWEIGIRQAEKLYRTNLNRLVRDYKGILKFSILAEQSMVSVPMIAEGRLGIEVRGESLSIDRKIFRITQPSSFKKVAEWIPKVRVEK